ncbi:MAG: 50S ribosomal protein L24 [Verrucomicrobiae bacterium]|nr:50S ribosomal protein L24 [Verrucomicrobiae bacterium]
MSRHVKKNDLVVVIAGTQKGRRGKILEVYPEKNRAIIEGVRMIKKHLRKSQDRPKGGIVEMEGTIHISNLMKAEIYDASKKRPKAAAAA